ncbi:hypothetical protein J6590_017989 [Homalodisca vitripennis]|nr:hypothetical protein J6590_017989 [Homalodisca vitripennis]
MLMWSYYTIMWQQRQRKCTLYPVPTRRDERHTPWRSARLLRWRTKHLSINLGSCSPTRITRGDRRRLSPAPRQGNRSL